MTISRLARIALISVALALPSAPTLAAEKAMKAGASIPAPPAGKGQVLFYRPGSLIGAAIICNVREKGHLIGRPSNGRYFIVTVDPGPHTYTTHSEATDTLNVEVEPDETNYVKCKIGAGVMAGRPNLSPSTKAEFDLKSAKFKPMEADKLAKMIADDEAKMSSAPMKK
jgi:hypothetical protein